MISTNNKIRNENPASTGSLADSKRVFFLHSICLARARTNERAASISTIEIDAAGSRPGFRQKRSKALRKRVESVSKACRKPARTCQKPGCKPGRKPGLQPGLQLGKIMECSLKCTWEAGLEAPEHLIHYVHVNMQTGQIIARPCTAAYTDCGCCANIASLILL